MKKFLYNTLLASNFLLGIGDVSAMDENVQETQQGVSPLSAAALQQNQEHLATFEDIQNFDNLRNTLLREVTTIKQWSKEHPDRDIFEGSTPEELAEAINSGDINVLEALPEFLIYKELNYMELLSLTIESYNLTFPVRIVTSPDFKKFNGELYREADIPDLQKYGIGFFITDDVKLICGPEREEEAKKIAKLISPIITRATNKDIEIARKNYGAFHGFRFQERLATTLECSKEAAQFAKGIKIDESTLFDIILNDNVDTFIKFIDTASDSEFITDLQTASVILSTVLGSSKIFQYCANHLESIDYHDLIGKCAIAGGNMEIIHSLEHENFFENKTVAALLDKDIMPFVRCAVFDWFCMHYDLASSDEEYTDFIASLIEVGYLFPALCLIQEYKTRPNNEKLCNRQQFNKSDIIFNRLLPVVAKTGHLNFIKYLVEKCHANVEAKDNFGNTPLYYASREGHFDTMKYLVEQCYANVKTRGTHGYTPLHWASKNGHLDIVQYLVEKCHCDVTAKDCFDKTPLHLAAESDHLDIEKYLVEKGHADVEAKDYFDRTPLRIASERRHFDIEEYLNVINQNKDKLFEAVRKGNLDTVKKLIAECHCNVETTDNMSATPLHVASTNGHLNIVKYLVEECNAKIDEAVISVAETAGQSEITNYFNRHRNKLEKLKQDVQSGNIDEVKATIENHPYLLEANELLSIATKKGHFDIVKYLAEECHCNVVIKDNKDIHNPTLLHVASMNGHFDIVKYFIEEWHCNVEAMDTAGRTPLHYASGTGHLDIAKYLVEECHCDVEAKDKRGKTPLHYASLEGHEGYLDIVKYLVEECHANVETKCDKRWTPLHYASYNGHLNIVKYLVEECRCDIEAKDSNGWTPMDIAKTTQSKEISAYFDSVNPNFDSVKQNRIELFKAAREGNLEKVKDLVEEYNADVEAKDNYGMTPLHKASEKGHLDIVKYLVEEGHANIEAKSRGGSTPLLIASKNGHLDIVKYLVEDCHAEITEEIIEMADNKVKEYLCVFINL